MGSQEGAKVGFVSRIDYGSPGFRSGLVRAGFEIFVKEQINFIIMPGGLVAKKALTEKMNAWIKEQLSVRKNGGSRNNNKAARPRKKKNGNGLSVSEKLRIKKGELRTEFLSGVAKELAELIPITTVPDPEDAAKKKNLDLFITTSLAFDGEIGEDVAQLLAELRSDIKVWNVGGDRFPVLYVDKLIWALAPSKATWMRGDYFSTPVERVIKDKIKQTSQSSPDRFVVGCFGSSINKTKGELKYAYVSVPALSRLEETRVNENQIGVCVLEYPADNSDSLWRNHSLKDMVSRELDFIVPPTEIEDGGGNMIPVEEFYAVRQNAADSDAWVWERKNQLVRHYFEQIEGGDAIVVANYDKNGIEGYIGGNTLMEMAISFFLHKPIYLVNPIPDVQYKEEIVAMRPRVGVGELFA